MIYRTNADPHAEERRREEEEVEKIAAQSRSRRRRAAIGVAVFVAIALPVIFALPSAVRPEHPEHVQCEYINQHWPDSPELDTGAVTKKCGWTYR